MNRDDLLGAHGGYGYGACLRFDQIVDTSPKVEPAPPPVERDVSWRERVIAKREAAKVIPVKDDAPSFDWEGALQKLQEQIEWATIRTPAPYVFTPNTCGTGVSVSDGTGGEFRYASAADASADIPLNDDRYVSLGAGKMVQAPAYTNYPRVTVAPGKSVTLAGIHVVCPPKLSAEPSPLEVVELKTIKPGVRAVSGGPLGGPLGDGRSLGEILFGEDDE